MDWFFMMKRKKQAAFKISSGSSSLKHSKKLKYRAENTLKTASCTAEF